MFYIPIENYPKFEKKVQAIKNKGGNIITSIGKPEVLAVGSDDKAWPEVEKGSPAWEQSPKHKFIPVEIEGSYEIPGWEFVGTVEHTPNGNIIRNITDEKIPTRYLTSSPECEHCHRIRDRKDTYLVKNTETGEFKQVGKTCLKDYTGGLDSQVAAQIAEIINDPEEFFGLEGGFGKSSGYYWDKKFKKAAYNYIKEKGYKKDDAVWMSGLEKAYKGTDLASDADIQAVDEWVDNLDTSTNEYFRNASLAWKLEDLEYRHLRLIASLINTYFKDIERQKQIEIKRAESTSEYVGNIGDKITFVVASSRVIYNKSFSYGYYHSTFTKVNRIVGTDGNIYIWATNDDFKEGDTITGTVKSHDEYQGEKQTTITRGKVVGGLKDQFKKLGKEFDRLDREMKKRFGKDSEDFGIWYDTSLFGGTQDEIDEITKKLDMLRAKYAELNDAELNKAFDPFTLDEE